MQANWIKCALLAMLLSACGSMQPSADPMTLPPPPKPQVPESLMRPLPEQLHFLNQLRAIFSTSPNELMK